MADDPNPLEDILRFHAEKFQDAPSAARLARLAKTAKHILAPLLDDLAALLIQLDDTELVGGDIALPSSKSPIVMCAMPTRSILRPRSGRGCGVMFACRKWRRPRGKSLRSASDSGAWPWAALLKLANGRRSC